VTRPVRALPPFREARRLAASPYLDPGPLQRRPGRGYPGRCLVADAGEENSDCSEPCIRPACVPDAMGAAPEPGVGIPDIIGSRANSLVGRVLEPHVEREIDSGDPDRLQRACSFMERMALNRNTEKTRWCTRCRQDLPVALFRPNPEMLSGLHPWCRPCCAEDIRLWRAENPSAVAAYNAARREGPFPKTCSVCGREWLAARRRSVRCPECQERHLRERKR
jgi:hypothetical protein